VKEVADFDLLYGLTTVKVSLPLHQVAWVVSPRRLEPVQDVMAEVRRALAQPIGSPDLATLVRQRGKKTVILVDDYTRATPAAAVLRPLLAELNAAGVADEDITLLTALGTHRAMTETECAERYGADVVRRVRVVNHDWQDQANLVELGRTKSGIPIVLNRRFLEAELKIATGNIIPHIYAGWSGGAKAVQPGISGGATTAMTHVIAALNCTEILGAAENPVRREMEDIARQAGLDFIVNTVLNTDGSIVRVVAGDVVAAHREGVEWSKKVYAARVDRRPDIVLVSANPSYFDFWQATKPITVATCFVKPGGTIVAVTPCTEGVVPDHEEMLTWGAMSVKEVHELLRSGRIKDGVAAAVHMTLSACRERAHVIVVSEPCWEPGIRKLGFDFAGNVEIALLMAFEREGGDASVGILTHGADSTPER